MSHELREQSHAKNTKFSMLNIKKLQESVGLDMIIETINQTAKLSQHTCRWTIQNTGGKYPVDKLMVINRLFSIGHFIFSDLKTKESMSCLLRPVTSHSGLRECLFSEKPIFTQLSLRVLESKKISHIFQVNGNQSFTTIFLYRSLLIMPP